MDVGVYPYPHGDPLLIDKIVNEFLSQGKFDKLRKECMSDADTKPAYQNLQQRVESTVSQFLAKQIWKPDLNKNQLRDSLRKHILESNFFDAGINRIVDQVVNPNVLATVFLPEVEEVVYNYLSIPRPPDKNQKKVPISNAESVERPPAGETNTKEYIHNDKFEKDSKERPESQGDQGMVEMDARTKNGNYKVTVKTEQPSEDKTKKNEIPKSQTIKTEDKIKMEVDNVKKEEGSQMEFQESLEKMEIMFDDSQESFSRMTVQGIHLNEAERIPVLESDDSLHLEMNEKSMSESRDSEDSIMNQMSPISQGRLTPDLIEEEKVEEKEEKKPLTFIGRIPKLKREDSESSKSSKGKEEVSKREKLDVKHVYSSDESDSSKSLGKSDSDERKSKDQKKREERSQTKDIKKSRDESEKKRKHSYHHRDSRDRDKDRKSRSEKSKDQSSKDRKRERSRERHGIKKSSSSSSSSYSRDKSSGRHKSSRHESRRRSKEGSHDERKRKEHEKKKSKSTDDHGKERNKKEERRSTDRDSNEREIDKSASGRSQEETKKREKEQKGEGNSSRDEKTPKEDIPAENETEPISEDGAVLVEMEVGWISEEDVVVSQLEEGWISGVAQNTEDQGPPAKMQVSVDSNTYRGTSEVSDILPTLVFSELIEKGALSRVQFPKLTDDFYVKFNSTGFRYFEEWEQSKLDCEEEFKDFVDEAENNLDLISDDESDFELELETKFDFAEENQKTIRNLLKGWGNFKKSLMFDPAASEFYKWTNGKFYQKFRRKNQTRRQGSVEKNESDESIKENIERRKRSSDQSEDSECHKGKNKENLARERKALHLKLLNRYRRKALRHGTHKRRHRRKKNPSESGGIKEKNENQNACDVRIKNLRNHEPENGFLFKSEVMGVSETEAKFLNSNYSGKVSGKVEGTGFSLVEGKEADSERNHRVNSFSQVKNDFERKSSSGLGNIEILPESPVDSGIYSESPDSQKRKKGFVDELMSQKPKAQELYLNNESLKCGTLIEKCNFPLSPDSDDNTNVNVVSSQNLTSRKNKRLQKSGPENGRMVKKPRKQRNNCQKYDNQDLYKPRPILNSSRMRGREKGPDADF